MTNSALPNRAGIESRQLRNLRSLIGDLLSGNRYYGSVLREAGITPSIESLQAFSERMPFTTKQQMVDDQRLNPPFGSNLTYPLERYTRFNQTSATTGAPLRWLDTPESWEWMLDNWRRVFNAAGVLPRDRLYFAFSFGPFLGFWTAFDAAATLGCLCIPGGGMTSSARLQAILENEVTVVCCTPTYALRLAEVAAAENIDLSRSRVRRIIVAGEAGGSIAGTRSRIESLWPNSNVFDHHGMTEVGPVSYECPARHGSLHIMESSYLAEVVDAETGLPAGPDNSGELVLTTLGRNAMPLLRYRTGDLVAPRFESPCVCGSYECALSGGILARTDDMVIVRGVNVYPSAVEDVLRGHRGIVEYRVLVHSRHAMTELELEVELDPELEDEKAVLAQLERHLRDVFAMRVSVKPMLPGSLPRFEMKAKRWVKM